MNRDLLRVTMHDDPTSAVVRIGSAADNAPRVPEFLTGKFCEHLGANIYNGMQAQVLKNPTFGDVPFARAGLHADGGVKFFVDDDTIAERLHHGAERMPLPEGTVARWIEDRLDALAHPWLRVGEREAVKPSPDVAPNGNRAQRVAVSAAGEGIAQYTYLPLHRVREYEWHIMARSDSLTSLTLSLTTTEGDVIAEARVEGPSRAWQSIAGTLIVPDDVPDDALYVLRITADAAGQFVIARALFTPADHVDGADPDVIRFLKDSRLPLLRWPGGNFASGYRWRDGIGPADERPTGVNPCWGGPEPNLFGTDEFVAFCRAVGCEPMICINVGSDTPAEAAAWIEYCNAPADTPMGALRAANGHAEPYGIRQWEVGNEIYGRHQIGWTTAAGYADRYREFAEAMRAADPAIHLVANGCAAMINWRGEDWNGILLDANGASVESIADHILIGGGIPASTDPMDVYADFMARAVAHEPLYASLRNRMLAAGVAEPRMAVTELQLFGRRNEPAEGEAVRLTRETLVSPATMAEAVFATLVFHVSARLAPFVEMITHSATVNHGGGLRKERERVYANPCHYAWAMLDAVTGGRVCPVAVRCGVEAVPGVLDLTRRNDPPGRDHPILDVIAAEQDDGTRFVSLVHRGRGEPVSVSLTVDGCDADTAAATSLSADRPWDINTLELPTAIVPRALPVEAAEGAARITLPPCSVTVVGLRAAAVSRFAGGASPCT